MSIERLVDMINAVTGWNTDITELLTAGERAMTLSRIYNHREGFTERDDLLPERFTLNMKDGPYRDRLGIEKAGFYAMRSDFYDEMGWDPGTGYPTAGRIAELGIEVPVTHGTDSD